MYDQKNIFFVFTSVTLLSETKASSYIKNNKPSTVALLCPSHRFSC